MNIEKKSIIYLVLLVIGMIGLVVLYQTYHNRHILSNEFREEAREMVDEQTVSYLASAFVYEELAEYLRTRDASFMRLFTEDSRDFDARIRALDIPFTSRVEILQELGYDPEEVQSDLDYFMASFGLQLDLQLEDEESLILTPEMQFLATDTIYEFSLTFDGLFMVVVTNRSHFGVNRGVLFFDMMGNELDTRVVLNNSDNILDMFYQVNVDEARLRQKPSNNLDLVLATRHNEIEEIMEENGLDLELILDAPSVAFDPFNFIDSLSLVQIVTEDILAIETQDAIVQTTLNTSGTIGLRDITDVTVHKISHNFRGVQQGSNYTMNLVATLRSPQGNENVIIRVVCYGTTVVSYTIERFEVI